VLGELLAADYLPPVWVADQDTEASRRQVNATPVVGSGRG